MNLYSLSAKALHDQTERSVVLRALVSEKGSLKNTWWKVRREYYDDILVPQGGNGNWNKEVYAYVKVPVNEVWLLPVPVLHRAILANASSLQSRNIDGELCYFLTERHLTNWGIRYSIRSVPGVEAAILHGPWI